MRDLFMVGFLLVAAFYTFRRPYVGVAAWIWIALIAPANWAWGFSQSFRLNLSIVLITFLAYVFVMKRKSLPMSAVTIWVMLFGFWTLISTAFNIRSNPVELQSDLEEFIKVIMLFVFMVLIFRKRLHVDTMIWAIVLALSSYAAMEAVKFILSGGGYRIVGRAGRLADRNDLAVAINMCIPLVVYLIQVTRHKWLRLGLWGLLFLNIVSIVGTYSRGGFIGLCVLGIAFWLKSNYKLALTLILILAAPVLYQNAPEDWKARQSTVSTAANQDSSFIGRLWAWKISTMIALDNPLTGGGFRSITDRSIWDYYAPRTPEFGPIDTAPIPTGLRPKAAHNIYFQVLGDHGFVGLFFFGMILLTALLNTIKNSKLGKEYGVYWFHHLSNALTLSLVGYGITGLNVSLAYFDLLYAIVGTVTVMTMLRRNFLPMMSKDASQSRIRPIRGGSVLVSEWP